MHYSRCEAGFNATNPGVRVVLMSQSRCEGGKHWRGKHPKPKNTHKLLHSLTPPTGIQTLSPSIIHLLANTSNTNQDHRSHLQPPTTISLSLSQNQGNCLSCHHLPEFCHLCALQPTGTKLPSRTVWTTVNCNTNISIHSLINHQTQKWEESSLLHNSAVANSHSPLYSPSAPWLHTPAATHWSREAITIFVWKTSITKHHTKNSL
jgi:hypothetical protein